MTFSTKARLDEGGQVGLVRIFKTEEVLLVRRGLRLHTTNVIVLDITLMPK
jgi:hypothetical protein